MEREPGYFKPMQELPRVSVDDKSFSETVIVYGEELDDHDFGYYDFTDKTWNVLGDFAMKMICWSYPETPGKTEIAGFVPVETPVYKKTRIPPPDEKSVETLLAEQHRNTRHDAVEIVDLWIRPFMYEHSGITDQLSSLFDSISHDIHNLKQRKP